MSNYLLETVQYAEVFKALSNPHRLQIFELLSGCCTPGTECVLDSSCCVGDLGNNLDIAASTLSHHLKELNRAGLIEMKREGKNIHCSVNSQTLAKIKSYFNH